MRFHRHPSGLFLPEHEILTPGWCDILMVNELSGFGVGNQATTPTAHDAAVEKSWTSAVASQTQSYTTTSANGLCLAVRVACRDDATGTTVSTVTFNGVAMTKRAEASGGSSASLLSSIWTTADADTPFVGTADVVVTFSAATVNDGRIRIETYKDVNMVAPVGGTATDAPGAAVTSITANVTKQKTLSLILAAHALRLTGATTEDTDMTEETDLTQGSVRSWFGRNTVNGDANWTFGSEQASGAAIELSGE